MPTDTNTKTSTNTPVPASRERSTGARVLLIVASAVAGLTSAVLITLGGLAFLGEDQKDERGYLSTDSERFQTGTRALASESLDVDLDGVEGLIDSTGLGDIRIEVEPDSDKPVFVGIARTDEVDHYLRGVAHSAVVDVDVDPFEASYSPQAGRDRPEAPGGQRFWAASAHGAGAQTLTWEVEDGDWSVVVMNEDGSPAVRADVSAGATLPFLDEIGWSALGAGAFLLLTSIGLLVLGVRTPRSRS
ncbi:MAG TPA: hypothetical protein VFB44_16410 [Thermoleophilaceae bacterium]|nr:hypothetical protein [Thermoleophilaceae bacterium]